MKNDTPNHLKHIDKTSAETKRVISELENKDKFGDYPLNVSKRKIEKNKGLNDPLKEELDILLHRLYQPYCTYREDNKIWLKRKLSSLRKTDPKAFQLEIKKESAKLDELEREYEKRQLLRQEKKKKKEFEEKSLSLLEKFKFWLSRLNNSDLYSNKSPSIFALNNIEVEFKNSYEKIKRTIDLIVYTKFSKDFFDNNGRKAQYSSYNILSLLREDSMGKALASITTSRGSLSDIEDKINELKDFSTLYITLIDDQKNTKKLLKDIDVLIEIIQDPKSISTPFVDKPPLTPDKLKFLKREILTLFDKSVYLPKLLAIYSCFFEYRINTNTLREYLDVKILEEESILLSPPAQKNCQKWKSKLESDIKYNQNYLNKVVQMQREVSLGDLFAKNSLANSQPRDVIDYESYPLLFLNKMVTDFLNIFENFIVGRKQVILQDHESSENHEKGGAPLFKEAGGHLEKEIRSLLVQHDLTRKIRKSNDQDVNTFRLNVFDEKTDIYRDFSSTVSYVKKQNGNIYFKFMRLFERELHSNMSGKLLEKKILDKEILQKLNALYSLEEGNRQPNGENNQSCLIITDQFGREKEFLPNSFYALLKLGQTMTCYFANYVGEKTVKNLMSSKSSKEITIDELQSKLMLLP